jgi:hypothetical protein
MNEPETGEFWWVCYEASTGYSALTVAYVQATGYTRKPEIFIVGSEVPCDADELIWIARLERPPGDFSEPSM